MYSIIIQITLIPIDLAIPFISGLFEMTIGSDLISTTTGVTLLQQSDCRFFLLAFGGFSIKPK